MRYVFILILGVDDACFFIKSSLFMLYFFFNVLLQISDILCLMDCSSSSTDKKTLKRWFFIDKRVG